MSGGRDIHSPSTPSEAGSAGRIGFREVLRNRSFAGLFAAEMQSIIGDQLARVALSVLVFDRTGSAVATAGTYAATLLPAIIGGSLLSRIGDLLPKRVVMIGVDLARALCFAAMALPQLPLGAVIAVLIAAVAIGPVFSAAQLSYLADVLTPEEFRIATATRLMTSQTAQVLGFLLGGGLVAMIGARATLVVDAATFVVSALIVATLIRGGDPARRQSMPDGRDGSTIDAPADATQSGHERTEGSEESFAGLLRTPRVRGLILLACVIGLFVVPEGLAVPFARSTGAGTTEIGILLAAGALGGAVGSAALGRLVRPSHRETIAYRMAVLCGLPLLIPAFVPSWPLAAVCWLASGALAGYMVEVTAALVQELPEDQRSRYLGMVGATLLAVQGVGMLAFGALATVLAPATAIGVAGLAGSVFAFAVVTLGGVRQAARGPAHPTPDGLATARVQTRQHAR
jgi:predicted MFS family arabinose efflux permease